MPAGRRRCRGHWNRAGGGAGCSSTGAPACVLCTARSGCATAVRGRQMKAYSTPFIRNVGIVGHGDTGKTQLVSSLLFTAGMTNRLGKVAEGNTVTDWDEEEIARKITIKTGLAFAEWAPPGQNEKTKINFLDTPGKCQPGLDGDLASDLLF